jgi:hypothetical protein
LRGFKKTSLQGLTLQSTGMEFALEMIVRATMLGMRVTEVPTTLAPDGRDRRPHLRTWRDGWRSLRFFLLYSPRWLFLYPGVTLIALGALVGVWLAIGPYLLGRFELDVHTMLYSATAVVLGFQAVLFAIFSKVLAMNAGFHPKNERVEKWLRANFLEAGLAVGVLLIALGLGLSVHAVQVWQQRAFHALEPSSGMRLVIPAVLALILGSQAVFSSFYLCLLRLHSQRLWRQDQQSQPGRLRVKDELFV